MDEKSLLIILPIYFMGINHPLVLASAGISAYKLAYEQFGSLSDTEANVIYLVSFFVINLVRVESSWHSEYSIAIR